jgi:hypothetical protein
MPESPADALQLETVDGVTVVRLAATHRVFAEAVALFTAVIRRMVAEGQPHLLLDVVHAGFAPPDMLERLAMVREWAQAADGRLRIAMVARPEYIDPERFGIVAAGNFGLAGQVFEREADAIAWLHDERAAELRRKALLPQS